MEGVDVGQILHQPLFDEECGRLFAHTGDVHGRTADKILEAANQLGGAVGVVAVNGHFPLGLGGGFAAGGAMGGRGDGLLGAIAQFQHGADHVGNDFARPLDQNGVAEANLFAADFVEVVQGGVLDNHPADFDGFEDGRWG